MTRFIHSENCICILKDYLLLPPRCSWIHRTDNHQRVIAAVATDQTSWNYEMWVLAPSIRSPPTDFVPCRAASIIINCMLMRQFDRGNLHVWIGKRHWWWHTETAETMAGACSVAVFNHVHILFALHNQSRKKEREFKAKPTKNLSEIQQLVVHCSIVAVQVWWTPNAAN